MFCHFFSHSIVLNFFGSAWYIYQFAHVCYLSLHDTRRLQGWLHHIERKQRKRYAVLSGVVDPAAFGSGATIHGLNCHNRIKGPDLWASSSFKISLSLDLNSLTLARIHVCASVVFLQSKCHGVLFIFEHD